MYMKFENILDFATQTFFEENKFKKKLLSDFKI